VPYLTPQDLPESADCRALFVPDDTEWLALFGGALTELTKTWNWEYSGGLTVDETVAKMTEIINNWYSGCVACTLPGGGSAIRVRPDGHIEELLPDGSWGDPTGDYVLPPITPREEGTDADKKCLAAKNAANVLEQLYENIADSYGDGLTDAEALTALIEFVVTLIGVAFAPIAFAIATFLLPIFIAAYAIVAFITADLWDSNFTDQLVCILLNCAVVDGDIVTFDWDCFNNALWEQLNDFGLSTEQLRLYGQIQIILSIIGGVDALNLAGATTDITDDTCDCELVCPDTCYVPTAVEWSEPLCSGAGNLIFTPEGMFSNIHNVGLNQGAIANLNDFVSPSVGGWLVCYQATEGITMRAALCAEGEGTYPACYSGTTVSLGLTPGVPIFVDADHPIIFLGWAADDNGITGLCIEPA